MMVKGPFKALLFATLFGLIPSNLRGQDLLNFNFGHSNVFKQGLAEIEKTPADFLNEYSFPFTTRGELSDLRFPYESASGINLRLLNAPGQWVNTTRDRMYDGSIYLSGETQVTLTELSPETYGVILFGHASFDQGNSLFEVFTREKAQNPTSKRFMNRPPHDDEHRAHAGPFVSTTSFAPKYATDGIRPKDHETEVMIVIVF